MSPEAVGIPWAPAETDPAPVPIPHEAGMIADHWEAREVELSSSRWARLLRELVSCWKEPAQKKRDGFHVLELRRGNIGTKRRTKY